MLGSQLLITIKHDHFWLWIRRLASSEEPVQEKVGKQILKQGFLLEFKKDTRRILLAVAQKPDGKKNWIVFDQI